MSETCNTGSPSTAQHRSAASGRGAIAIALVTVSDTRTPDTDVNGQFLRGQIEAKGHVVASYRIIKDEPEQVRDALEQAATGGARVVLFNGGTGIAKRDMTIDVVSRMLEKEMPGFGELFRMLSWEQVGPAAMLSRATAGLYKGVIVFCTPGSSAAVRLAWEKLLGPELEHLVWELTR